jgi:hypothetical protein
VEPALHQSYTIDEAVRAFGSAATAEFLCDDQVVILTTAVLCMATVGDPATQAHVSSPSHVVWRAGRLDYAPFEEHSWLPVKAREVWGPDRKKVKGHHVFLRLPGDERFFYAGKAHLASYGGPRSGGLPSQRTADFSLDQKLPRDMWVRLGGYPGWLVEINHRSERVDTGDLDAFRQLMAELPSEEFSHLEMTRFEEDSLSVFTNARRGWLMYKRDPYDPGLYTWDTAYTGTSEAREMFRCVCGIELDFLSDQTLPRDLAIGIAQEFFTVGELPKSANWRPQ